MTSDCAHDNGNKQPEPKSSRKSLDLFSIDELDIKKFSEAVNFTRSWSNSTTGCPSMSHTHGSSHEPSLEEDDEVVEMQKNPAYSPCQRESLRFTQRWYDIEAVHDDHCS